MEQYDAVGRPQMAMGGIGMMADNKPEIITLVRHKAVVKLAYEIKDYIDRSGGITPMESCLLGEVMQRIVNLK